MFHTTPPHAADSQNLAGAAPEQWPQLWYRKVFLSWIGVEPECAVTVSGLGDIIANLCRLAHGGSQ